MSRCLLRHAVAMRPLIDPCELGEDVGLREIGPQQVSPLVVWKSVQPRMGDCVQSDSRDCV